MKRHETDTNILGGKIVDHDLLSQEIDEFSGGTKAMNKIIESLLNNFRSQNALPLSMPESDAYERFAAFIAIEPIAQRSVSPEDFVIGENAQPDVDFVSIIVNGVPVGDPDEVDALADTNKYVDAHLVFGQAKTSSSFDVKVLGSLGDFVEHFVTEGCTNADNEKIKRFHAIWLRVLEHANIFRDKNPSISLFYITAGSEPLATDINFTKKTKIILQRLKKTEVFGEISIKLIGASETQKRYKQLTNQLSADLDFPKKIAIGHIEKVKNAFVGVIPADEFRKLIIGAAGEVLQAAFYDNVRDWQGLNPVNTVMQETLKSKSRKERFVVMNNGVTVIAKKIRQVNERLLLDDYQIVNGCQTSHVLARMDPKELLRVMIPLRVMETSDDEVIRDVIQATNNQTAVTQPQLLAVTDFQKGLEAYFLTHEEPGLRYERRSKQYSGARVDKTKIVTPLGLVKAVAAMYRNEPHKTARDFSSILKDLGSSIFAAAHKYEPYYAAAVLNYWIEYFMRNGHIPSSIRPARYQLIYAFRLFYENETSTDLGSRVVEKNAQSLLGKLLSNEASALKALEEPAKIIVSLMRGKTRTEPRTLSFTEKVKNSVVKRKAKLDEISTLKKPVVPTKLVPAKSVLNKKKTVPIKAVVAKTAAKKTVAAKKLPNGRVK